MKKLINIAVILIALSFLVSCSESSFDTNFSLSPAVQQIIDDAQPMCGEPTIVTLFAGQTIDSGSVVVWNNTENLYIAFSAENGWQMSETHVAVATNLDGIPQQNGNPIPGQFPYKREYNPWVTQDIYVIPLVWDADTKLYIAAHASLHLTSGENIQQETGWANGTNFSGANWATYFCYTIQSCTNTNAVETNQFRTQTQGGWGTTAKGNNPGTYRDSHFTNCFADGVLIGHADGYYVVFSTSYAVESFLPQGGTAGSFTSNYSDPLTTEAGVLGGQVLALTLSVGFDLCDDDFGASDTNLKDLVVADTSSPCYGWTVAAVLAEANKILAGLASTLTVSQINECVSQINENYVDGTTDNGFLEI
ncbi:MAG: hypothetical protein KAR07_00775 [Spirochaetes bacterium]|nr:hypothetical protein [Spirochaetota bacterium]